MSQKETPQPVEVKTDVTLADYTLFFELEYTLLNVRDTLYEAIAGFLGEHSEMPFPVPAFSRYCLYPAPSFYAKDLGKTYGLNADKTARLQSTIDSALKACINSDTPRIHTRMKDLLESAIEYGLQVHALTALPAKTAQKQLKAAGMDELGIGMFTCDEIDEFFPRADTWIRMARELGRHARRVVAFASSSRACKATLSAGMRAVAVPDAYTAYQDFSGVELILDENTEHTAREVLAMLYPLAR